MNHRILLLNGPNLNFLGIREPQIYGKIKLQELEKKLMQMARERQVELSCFQSNHEGDIVDRIQEGYGAIDGIILNPASLSQSYPIREAITSTKIPTVEVHISNIFARESWHQISVIAPVTIGQIVGFGVYSYVLALEALLNYLRREIR